VALARRGLALLQALPSPLEHARRELPLLVTLGVQLQVVQGYAAPEVEQIYHRAWTLCEQLKEAPPLFRVLWGLWMFYEVSSHLEKSRELAQRLFTLAHEAQDSALLIQACMATAVTSFSLGELTATREHSEQGVALYDPRRHSGHTDLYGQDPEAGCLAFMGVALWLLGYPDQAVQRSRQAVEQGGKVRHPTSHALALYFATMLQQYCRDAPAVQKGAEATTAIAIEHGLSLWRANGLIMGGWARAEQGAWASGIAMLRKGLADWADTGAETHRTYFLGLLAEALGRGEQFEEGLGVIAEALTLTESTGTVFHNAELHRLQGEFLLRREESEAAGRAAESCFLRALEAARRQQAKSLELRALMSLTRLYQKQDRTADVRPMLAECYHWFTEGFETPDLREARALLELIA
jgi:predicted ATPase